MKKLMKRFAVSLGIILVVMFTLTACDNQDAGSDDYALSGDIRFIVPFGVGGTADAIARMYATIANDMFPEVNFIVENMTGGDGFLALDYFTQLPADTQTVTMMGYGSAYRHDLGVLHGTEIVTFDRHELKPVAVIDDRTWIVYVTPGTTLEDILELGRTDTVRMSGGNPLSDPHLAFGSLIANEGGSVMTIPFDGGAMQRQALLNGEVDVFVGTTQAGIEEVTAGLMIPLLAISEHSFEGFVTPEGAISVPAVAGPDRHPGLSQEHFGSILPAGGFLTLRQGANPEVVARHIEIARAVWANPEFYEWKEEILLNRFELYGEDILPHLESAVERALAAFDLLN